MKSKNNIEEIKERLNKILVHKNEQEEISHDSQMLMFQFLSEVQRFQDYKGIKRNKLAQIIKTSPSYLTQLFRGNKPLNFETIAKFQKVLDVKFNITAHASSGVIDIFDEQIFLLNTAKFRTDKGTWIFKNVSFEKPNYEKEVSILGTQKVKSSNESKAISA